MEAIKIGDRVEVTKDRDWTSRDVGARGVVKQIDDDSVPYLIECDNAEEMWVMEVRKIDTALAVDRASYVERAKALLSDIGHSCADIIRLAEFLAGE